MPNAIPPAGSDVLPASDADYGLFVTQFAAAWVPATFNVVLPAAATLVTSASDFNTALALASDPTSRTAAAIASKDLQRDLSAILFRNAIRAAQAAFLAGTATEAQVNNLGVRANSLLRTPIGDPLFPPILGVDGALQGQTRFRVTQVDPVTGIAVATRRYAYGLIGVEVERKIGAGPFVLRFLSKRIKFFDDTSGEAMGTVLAYRARYTTARGLVSPWSSIVQSVTF